MKNLYLIIILLLLGLNCLALDLNPKECKRDGVEQIVKLNCDDCDKWICISKVVCNTRSGPVSIDVACDAKNETQCPSIADCMSDSKVTIGKAPTSATPSYDNSANQSKGSIQQ